jgi:biopolymer transport protein ExbD
MARFASSRRSLPLLVVLAVAVGAPSVRAGQDDEPAALLHIAQEKDGHERYLLFRNTQAVLMTTRTVAADALKRRGVAELALVKRQKDPVGWLRQNLQVDFPHNAEVLRVSLKGGGGREAAVLINAVVDAYVEHYVYKGLEEPGRRLDMLRKATSDYEERLRHKREVLRRLADTLASGDAQTKGLRQRVVQESLKMTHKELLEVRSDLRKAQVELKALPEQQKDRATATSLRKRIDALREMEKSLTHEVEQLGKQLQQLAQDSVDVESLRDEIAQAETVLKKLSAQIASLETENLTTPRVNVIEKAEAALPAREKPKGKDVKPQKEASLTVQVQAVKGGARDGRIRTVVVVTGKKRQEVGAKRDQLLETLKKLRKEKGGETVRVEADANLLYSEVVEILDICKKAGFGKIGMYVPADEPELTNTDLIGVP